MPAVADEKWMGLPDINRVSEKELFDWPAKFLSWVRILGFSTLMLSASLVTLPIFLFNFIHFPLSVLPPLSFCPQFLL